MPKQIFTIKTRHLKTHTEFNTFIDKCGDFVIEVNGESIAFIDADNGTLYRLSLTKKSQEKTGLKFGNMGHLVLG